MADTVATGTDPSGCEAYRRLYEEIVKREVVWSEEDYCGGDTETINNYGDYIAPENW